MAHRGNLSLRAPILSTTSLLLLLLLLLRITPTNQVDIHLAYVTSGYYWGETGIGNSCTAISPGVCCLGFHPLGAAAVRFKHLTAGDIGAVWGPRTPGNFDNPCNNIVLDSARGPGIWTWRAGNVGTPREIRASGASYISLPRTLPVDEGTSRWLMAEGMLAMLWGGGEWFGSSGADVRFGDANWEQTKGMFGGTRKRVVRRDVRAGEKGRLWARSPMRVVFADVVEVGGEVCRGDGTANVMFTDSRGEKVNITDLLSRDMG